MNGELRHLIKPFTKFKTFPNVQNGYHKIMQKNSFYESWLMRGLEHQSRILSINRSNRNQASIESNRTPIGSNWVRQKLQDYFPHQFDWLSKSFDQLSRSLDQLKILELEFSQRRFHNLNFHFIIFINKNSPKLNIIITTYTYIHWERERES